MKLTLTFSQLVAIALAMLFAVGHTQANSENKVALVIGNSKYATSPLGNPGNDASDVAKLLEEQLGFSTQLVLDSDQAGMQRAIREFSKKMKQADVRLFYYAGHGVSIGGENYMVPINANINDEDEVQWEAIKTSLVLSEMAKLETGANVLILDACRDNPLPKSTRSSSRGLNKVEAPVGSLILYATAPGQVALDGTGRNGTFTKHLLRSLAAPNVHLGDIALDVRVAVMKDTRNRQVPWSESSLTRRIYLAGQVQATAAAQVSNIQSTTSNSEIGRPTQELERISSTKQEPIAEVASSDDYESSIVLAYAEAAKSGDPVAQARLGYIFDVGRSVKEDNNKAREWYEKASEQQQWDATVNLGVMYLNGDGVSSNKKRALDLFRAAAEANHPIAQRNLGAMLQYGDSVNVDYAKARFWFEKAAALGNTEAYVDLGDMYSHGLGLQQDDTKAYEWYLKAAQQGSAVAQSEVGYFLDEGLGVEQSHKNALKWFELSANQDYPVGLYNLAEMYELGKGVEINIEKARALYERAAQFGNDTAKQALVRIQSQ